MTTDDGRCKCGHYAVFHDWHWTGVSCDGGNDGACDCREFRTRAAALAAAAQPTDGRTGE